MRILRRPPKDYGAVTLPASSGTQAALVLRAELPDPPVILISSYPVNGWNHRNFFDFETLASDAAIFFQKLFLPSRPLSASELVGRNNTQPP